MTMTAFGQFLLPLNRIDVISYPLDGKDLDKTKVTYCETEFG